MSNSMSNCKSNSIYNCPHCNISIEVIEINCAIFRCGVYKSTGQQVEPHLSKEECDKIITKIWGCGKPFQLVNGTLVKCHYI